jgi:uncharacterized protein DUF3888
MKKRLVITLLILIIATIIIKFFFINTMANQGEEEPQDILYQDVIITALSPTINMAIADYCKNILSISPFYNSSTIKILNIERPNGYRTWYFIVNMEVRPFVGPHLLVGKDRISIELSYPGHTNILSFEHIEDYPLPEHYEDIYLR